ncbi:hypothetical protein ACIG0D_12245 [Streptomyces sp. NPDC052773]|uniref:hypothetical protein n=1 Tax=Streptomyces sp. NPDC052773 TaxID=3365693 RepID=UPI0037D2716F
MAEPALRAALDAFLSGLFWHDDPPRPPLEGLLHPAAGREGPGLPVACTPADVTRPAARWATAEPLLEGRRVAYGGHAADPGGWIADFDASAVLLREWAVVVTEADRRGWGVLGGRTETGRRGRCAPEGPRALGFPGRRAHSVVVHRR